MSFPLFFSFLLLSWLLMRVAGSCSGPLDWLHIRLTWEAFRNKKHGPHPRKTKQNLVWRDHLDNGRFQTHLKGIPVHSEGSELLR